MKWSSETLESTSLGIGLGVERMPSDMSYVGVLYSSLVSVCSPDSAVDKHERKNVNGLFQEFRCSTLESFWNILCDGVQYLRRSGVNVVGKKN